jgi:hypothetical protein
MISGVAATALIVAGGLVASGVATASAAPSRQCATPLGVTVDADGDLHHRFRLPNGLIEEKLVPGPDVDPLRSPARRLAKFGLPGRPSASDPASADWHAAASGLNRRTAPKPSCLVPDLYAINLPTIAGYRARAASGKLYDGIHSSYTAPEFYLSICVSESMSQWVGLSSGGGILAQTGVYVDQWFGSPARSGAFYEIIGGSLATGPLVDMGLSYFEGHRYYFSVAVADSQTLVFLVNNLTNDTFVSAQIVGAIGSTAVYRNPIGYFVSERLVHGNPDTGQMLISRYMSHSNVRFRTAKVHIWGETDARLSIQRPEVVNMFSRDNTVQLGRGFDLNTELSNFSEAWMACGQVE